MRGKLEGDRYAVIASKLAPTGFNGVCTIAATPIIHCGSELARDKVRRTFDG
jgi:hypothetical protein